MMIIVSRIIIVNLKIGRVRKVDVSSTFIENIFGPSQF